MARLHMLLQALPGLLARWQVRAWCMDAMKTYALPAATQRFAVQRTAWRLDEETGADDHRSERYRDIAQPQHDDDDFGH